MVRIFHLSLEQWESIEDFQQEGGMKQFEKQMEKKYFAFFYPQQLKKVLTCYMEFSAFFVKLLVRFLWQSLGMALLKLK